MNSFIDTANPVGSRFLQEAFDFPFSPATIRSEMGKLEEEGFLRSPHTSAGRVPTESGFRFYVAECLDVATVRPAVEEEFVSRMQKYYAEKRADENVYDTVSILTGMTPNVAFATVPSAERMFFLGFSNVLRQPEFSADPEVASGIFRVLEENFQTVLDSLNIGHQPKIFIGSENVIPAIQSCSLIVTKFKALNHDGYLGVLGPMRIDFARNVAAVEIATGFLQKAR